MLKTCSRPLSAIFVVAALLVAVFDLSPQEALADGPYAQAVLADHPIGYWRLGEGAGTAAVDSSGSGNNGQYTNVQLGTAGALRADGDTAMGLSGGSSNGMRVTVPIGPSFTAEVWARSNTPSWNTLGWIASARGPNGFIIHPDVGSVSFYVLGTVQDQYAYVASVTPADITAWHQYAMTYDSATGLAVAYLDGAEAGRRVVSVTRGTGTTIHFGMDDPCAGCNTSGRYGNGALDEAAVYNTALSADRIRAHRLASLAAAPTVSAPAPITAEATGPGGAAVAFAATAQDALGGALTPTCSPGAGATFAFGTTQVICSATDSAGQTGSASFAVTVRDTTPPVVTASATTADGQPYTFGNATRQDVTVTFACSDGGSGLAGACPAPQTFNTEGTFTAGAGSVSDLAGNTTPFQFGPIVIARTLTAHAVISPAPNANGWNNTGVRVSGVATSLAGGVACESVDVTGDGRGQVVNVRCTDRVGNTAVATATVNIDETPPAVAVTFSSQPNAAGWYNGPVTITPSGDDGLSGIASCPPITASTDGANRSVVVTCTDRAGNVGNAIVTLNIDRSPPVLTVPSSFDVTTNRPSVAVTYAGVDATDAVSGLPTGVSCSPRSGSSLLVGRTTVICTATDRAGNQTSRSFVVNVLNAAGGPVPAISRARSKAVPAGLTTRASTASAHAVTLQKAKAGLKKLQSSLSANTRARNAARTQKSALSAELTSLSSAYQDAKNKLWECQAVEEINARTYGSSGTTACGPDQQTVNDLSQRISSVRSQIPALNTKTNRLNVAIRTTAAAVKTTKVRIAATQKRIGSKPRVTAQVTNAGTGAATLNLANYVGQALSKTSRKFQIAKGVFADVQMVGMTNNARSTVTIAYPNVAAYDNKSYQLRYFNPSTGKYELVVSDGHKAPKKDTRNFKDARTGVVHGGKFTVTFSATSVPRIDQLSGTVVVPGDDITPPVIDGVPADLRLEATGPSGAVATFALPTASDEDVTDDAAVDEAPEEDLFSPEVTADVPSEDEAAPTADVPDVPLADDAVADADATDAVATSPTDADLPELSVPGEGDDLADALDALGDQDEILEPDGAVIDDGGVDVLVSCTPASGLLFGLLPPGPTTTAVRCTATDPAGNQSSADFNVTVQDTTPPAITGSRSPAASANGWNNGDVTVHFDCTDSASGIASCPADAVVGADGADQSVAGTARDRSGNAASTTVSGISVDKTPPTLAGAATTSPNGNGWYNGPVTVHWTAGDALSGVDASTVPADSTVNGEGAALGASASVKDRAGNATTATAGPFRIDRTSPAINGAPDRAANSNGWYNAPVTVAFNCSDALSGVASCSGPATLGAEGANQSVTGSAADNAGNTASATVSSINVDTTAPTINGATDRAANSNGWYNAPVGVTFNCSDALSGVATCPAPTTVSADGAKQSAAGTATDKAGNAASTTVSGINVDTTAPTIAGAVDRAANANGWYKAPVTVTFSCADALSGVASCSGPTTLGEGAGQNVTGAAADKAGNTASATVSGISVDTTKPQVACAQPDGLWHAADVTLACTASDGLSGLARGEDAAFGLTTAVPAGTETATASTGSRDVCDRAGNCAAAGPVGANKVDRKPPTIAITAPAAQTYLLNQRVAANYACADGGSGVATCDGPAASGAPIATGAVGTPTFAVNAADQVGNAGNASVSYRVAFNVCPQYDSTKTVKSGATIPIKVQLCDANGANVSSSAVVVTAQSVTRTSDSASSGVVDAGNANPDGNFRYDSSLGGYIYNLKTTGLATGTYTLTFTAAGDPTTHSAQFQVR